MLTDIEQAEWWIAYGQPNSQIVLLERGDPDRVAQTDAGFAKVFETIKRAGAYLEFDNQGRTVATKIAATTPIRLDTARNVPDDRSWGVLPEQPQAHRSEAEEAARQSSKPNISSVDDTSSCSMDQQTYEVLLSIIQKQGSVAFNKACDELSIDPKLAMETVNRQALKEVRAKQSGLRRFG